MCLQTFLLAQTDPPRCAPGIAEPQARSCPSSTRAASGDTQQCNLCLCPCRAPGQAQQRGDRGWLAAPGGFPSSQQSPGDLTCCQGWAEVTQAPKGWARAPAWLQHPQMEHMGNDLQHLDKVKGFLHDLCMVPQHLQEMGGAQPSSIPNHTKTSAWPPPCPCATPWE